MLTTWNLHSIPPGAPPAPILMSGFAPWRAHPDIFDDALWAVINKAKQRNAADAG